MCLQGDSLGCVCVSTLLCMFVCVFASKHSNLTPCVCVCSLGVIKLKQIKGN